jgi:hypothetical protein
MHDDPRSGRPPLVNEDLVRVVEQKIREKRQFTITSISRHFRQLSRPVLHEIEYILVLVNNPSELTICITLVISGIEKHIIVVILTIDLTETLNS